MNMKWPEEPYRGLRYYQPDDFPIFAGRKRDVVECAKALSEADVLLLHGRTGCGKSSFLRAGLKPYFERRSSTLEFATQKVGGAANEQTSAEGILVARSGDRPLQMLAELLFSLIEKLANDEMQLGVLFSDPKEALLNREDKESFVSEVGVDASLMMDCLEALADCVSGTPILVIDQAEEVFTLTSHGGAQRNFDLRNASGTVTEIEKQTLLLAHEYFRFLSNVSRERLGVKIIVSMRTEYKGQFDDEIAHHGNPGNIVGYFLPDLDREGIIEAIKTPTKDAPPEWGIGSGLDFYEFEYASGLPETIADVLLSSRPRGGVLPVLQVMCSRLYETSRYLNDLGRWKVTEVDFKKLGSVEDQVDYYLRESFEKALLKRGVEFSDLSPSIDRWYELLKNLVSVEADGRVTTRKISRKRLDDAAIQSSVLSYDSIREWLATDEAGILRKDSVEGQEEWSLGHDSIGLAIQKWWTNFGSTIPSRRSSITSRHTKDVARFTIDDLFGDEKPDAIELIIPDTLVWSHQMPFYAEKKGFFERLGFTVKLPGDLHAGQSEVTYKSLAENIYLSGANAQKRTLVPIERSNFPAKENSSLWSDFAIASLYTGFALIGPAIDGVGPASQFAENPGQGREGLETKRALENIEKLFKTIARPKDHATWTIYCYNETAKRFLDLVVAIAGCEKQLQSISVKILKDGVLSSTDPLASTLLTSQNSMIITSAVGRALCERSGFVTYADTQRLSYLIDEWYRGDAAALRDAYRRYRETISHITWQIGIKHEDWNKAPNRAIILRLASVAYCMLEQMIQNNDDFVRFIYDRFTKDMEKTDIRVDRESVKATIERSYTLIGFEDQARFFLDRGSEFGYWAEERGREESIDSVIREIYSELVNLRKQTFDSYDELNRDVISLREAVENLDLRPEMHQVELLKERAWKHYRIYNFYDSARFMSKAKQALQDIT